MHNSMLKKLGGFYSQKILYQLMSSYTYSAWYKLFDRTTETPMNIRGSQSMPIYYINYNQPILSCYVPYCPETTYSFYELYEPRNISLHIKDSNIPRDTIAENPSYILSITRPETIFSLADAKDTFHKIREIFSSYSLFQEPFQE